MAHILDNNHIIDDRYEVLNFHKEGGMQEVYKAIDLKLDRIVALKTPKGHSAYKRFANSAIASARVNHKNVAKAFDYLPLADKEIFVEEFIDGLNLQELLDDYFYYFDPHLIIRFAQQISRGLAASHHVKVVHRDIKPANIMVCCPESKLVFKITDFGIAKLTEQVLDSFTNNSVMSSTVLGALPYMAPELIKTSKNASYKSDVWSFGALLFHLLYGEPPFGYGLESAALISEGKIPDMKVPFEGKKQYQALANEIIEIIKLCLQHDPTRRPSTDDLINNFSQFCFSDTPRDGSRIRRYGVDSGKFGFTDKNNFLHTESFWGENDFLQPGNYVYFGTHGEENRVHPVVPLKKLLPF